MTWLSESLDVDAAVDELCQRIFLDEQADEILLLGPVLLASFAYAIMISPWYTFRHMKEKPPTSKPMQIWQPDALRGLSQVVWQCRRCYYAYR